ncbi:MAG: proline dehydrogenase family protein, partial [Gemmatimonadota bacterium]
MGLARKVLLQCSESSWLRERLSHRNFVHRAVRRFMPGEELGNAIDAARELSAHDLGAVFTILGENVTSAEEARGVAAAYERALEAVRAADLNADLSVKVTHLGLDIAEQIALDNLDSVIGSASEAGRLVVLDMEAANYVDRTLELYRSMRSRHENVGVCLQAYLYRTAADLDSLLDLGPLIRLVKGAYNEPANVAWPRKADVDLNYLLLADRLLEAKRADPGVRIAFGTHDERMIDGIIRRVEDLDLPPAAC